MVTESSAERSRKAACVSASVARAATRAERSGVPSSGKGGGDDSLEDGQELARRHTQSRCCESRTDDGLVDHTLPALDRARARVEVAPAPTVGRRNCQLVDVYAGRQSVREATIQSRRTRCSTYQCVQAPLSTFCFFERELRTISARGRSRRWILHRRRREGRQQKLITLDLSWYGSCGGLGGTGSTCGYMYTGDPVHPHRPQAGRRPVCP